MESLYEYIKLYTINEVTLNSSLIEFEKNKKYVIASYENNIINTLFIDYKFDKLLDRTTNYNFRFKYVYGCDFAINNDEIKTNVLKLTDDFNYNHLIDLLSTHYNKNINTLELVNNLNRGIIMNSTHNYKKNADKINNNNGIYVYLQDHKILNCNNTNYRPTHYLKHN